MHPSGIFRVFNVVDNKRIEVHSSDHHKIVQLDSMMDILGRLEIIGGSYIKNSGYTDYLGRSIHILRIYADVSDAPFTYKMTKDGTIYVRR